MSVCNVSGAWVKYKNMLGCSSLADAFYKDGGGQQFCREGDYMNNHGCAAVPATKTTELRRSITARRGCVKSLPILDINMPLGLYIAKFLFLKSNKAKFRILLL